MKKTLTFKQLKRLVKESGDRDDLTRFGRRDDATISVSNIRWDSDDDSLPTRVKLCVPYIGDISDDGNTIEEKRTGYIEEVERALNGHYHAWPEDFDFFVDDYGPCATLDESKKESTLGIERNLAKEDVSPSQLFRNITKIRNAVEKFNALRQQALDKIGDEDSLYYETGSTLQSGPHYISKMYMDLDVDQVTLTWEEDEMLGWKTRRVSQENHANASDEFEVDNLLDSIKYMSGCVKKALKYYEKLNPDNEEEVLADLEDDDSVEVSESEDGDWEYCVLVNNQYARKFKSAFYSGEKEPAHGDVSARQMHGGNVDGLWMGDCRFKTRKDAVACMAFLKRAHRNYTHPEDFMVADRAFWEKFGMKDREIENALWDADSRY